MVARESVHLFDVLVVGAGLAIVNGVSHEVHGEKRSGLFEERLEHFEHAFTVRHFLRFVKNVEDSGRDDIVETARHVVWRFRMEKRRREFPSAGIDKRLDGVGPRVSDVVIMVVEERLQVREAASVIEDGEAAGALDVTRQRPEPKLLPSFRPEYGG